MNRDELVVRRSGLGERLIIEALADGSTAVFDTVSQTVHSLNASAAAAFEACREEKTAPQLAHAMEATLGQPVTEDLALAAVSELERAGLVACSGSRRPEGSSRRSALSFVAAAAAALPVVLSLTVAEQKAYAGGAGSGTTTTTTRPL